MYLWLTFLIAFCMGLCGAAIAGQENTSVVKPEITYTKDVAPLLQKHCVACHRPNDIAPMSLTTYEEVLPFARTMRESVVQRGDRDHRRLGKKRNKKRRAWSLLSGPGAHARLAYQA